MNIGESDRRILRDLAKRLAELAARPVMTERIKLWKKHNSLQPTRPLILVFPEGGWTELLPQAALECEDERTRRWEEMLRRRLSYDELLPDDSVVTNEWLVPRVSHTTGWGLDPRRHASTESRGAWAFDPVLNDSDDIKKMHFPEVVLDEDFDQHLDEQKELFGDILEVKPSGIKRIMFQPMSQYVYRRGLSQTLIDLYSNPQLIHDVMVFFEEGYSNLIHQYEDMNLLELNNDNTYHATGGNSWTDELPPDDFDPEHVRPADMWASAEAQEFSEVSPAMHEEFVWQYERRLMEPFALTGYGCCEDLTRKLHFVKTLPSMRRISISPFADVDECAPQLKGDYIFSWKPQPAHLCGEFNPALIRDYIQHTVDVCRAHGCILEMVLKDTHTCDNHPERFTQWCETARNVAEG